MTNLDLVIQPPTPTSTRTSALVRVVPGQVTTPGRPRDHTAGHPPSARPHEAAVASRNTLGQSQLHPIPTQRRSPAPPSEEGSWPHVWAALDRAQANYDPLILDAAEKAVLECYRSAAQAVAKNAAPAHGLDQPQAETLAELALIKSIRQCRAWNIHGFELYVHAAVESELRTNARPAPVPPLTSPQ